MNKLAKVRAEVENIRKHYIEREDFDNGWNFALDRVISIIDSLPNEPVSEDFEEALAKEWQGYVDRGAATVDALEDNTQELAFAKGFYRGSKWQKEQDQSTIELAEDHAMLAGMEKMKEEMMEKAVDGKVIANGMGNPILHLWDKGRHLIGKKVKVIVIKED